MTTHDADVAGPVRRARLMWEGLTGAPVRFADGQLTVVAAPDSRTCPPGWVGIVVVGDAAIATAPDHDTATTVRAVLTERSPTEWTDPTVVSSMLPVVDVLGPACLAYTAAVTAPSDLAVDRETGSSALSDLASVTDPDEMAETSLDDADSPLFTARREGRAVAAAGYSLWPGGTAHIGVVTAPAWRGRGLAKAVGAAAARHALEAGLLPQWRARVPASRAAARAIGFRELGSQLSVRLG